MNIYLKRLLLFFSVLSTVSCVNNKTKQPVHVSEAFVQNWNADEAKSKGVHLEISLTGKVNEINVLAIVYNQMQVTPIVQIREGILIARADFDTGTRRMFEKPSVTTKRNMIIYTYRGKIYELTLNNILKKPEKYYPKQ